MAHCRLLARWGWLVSLFLLMGCIPAPSSRSAPTPASTQAPPTQNSTATFQPTALPQRVLQLTFVSEDQTGREGIYAVDLGCPAAIPPCLSQPRRLFDAPAMISQISWSPDGKHATYRTLGTIDKGDIYVVDWDGRNSRNITQSPAYENFPAWSPDGRRIAYDSCTEYGCRIMSSDPDGSNLTQLLSLAEIKRPGLVAWAPDETKLAFLANDKAGLYAQVHVANLDGTGLLQLTDKPTDHLSPAFSPDGAWISFTRYADPESLSDSDVFVIHPDGSNETNLTKGVVRVQLSSAWAPTGDWIAFDGSQGYDADYHRNYNIYLMKPDGSTVITVTQGFNKTNFFPAWRSSQP